LFLNHRVYLRVYVFESRARGLCGGRETPVWGIWVTRRV
jgi:hypothetical protein